MGMSLTALRQGVWRACGTDEFDDGFSSDDVDLLLNRSFWNICDKLDFRENEITIPFTFAIGDRKYEMPADFNALRSIAVFDENGASTDLERWDSKSYDAVYNNTVADEQSNNLPTKYYRESGHIVVWPTPDQEYSGVFHYWKNLSDLSDENDDLPLPQSWDEIIMVGAAGRGFISLGDMKRFSEANATINSWIADQVPTAAKEEKDSRMLHVEVPGREYP